MHKKIISTIALCLIIGASTISANAETKLNDINGHWANKQIQSFVNSGYVNGYGDGTFRPDNSITRVEFIKIVNKFFGFTNKQKVNFKDVSQIDWFYNDVCIAKEAGYINGYGDGTFKPNQPITREEVAKILVSIKNNEDFTYDKVQGFRDNINISEWAKPYVEGAIEAGYIKGNTNGELNPTNNITRAESVVMISRVDKLEENPYNPIYYELENPEFRASTRSEFLKLVNDYRQANGKQKLEEKENLNNLAESWSIHKTEWAFNGDTDPNGKSSNDLYPQYGGNSSEVNFETVAYSSLLSLNLNTPQTLANAMFDKAKKDVGYNATMLNDEFNVFGFGCYPRQVDGGLIVVYNTLEFSVK